MHMRNIKGKMTTKPRDVSSYMRRHYFEVWIDGFQDKTFTVFIDAYHDDDAETKLLEKFRYNKHTETHYEIWVDQFEEKKRSIYLKADDFILDKFRCRNFNKTAKV